MPMLADGALGDLDVGCLCKGVPVNCGTKCESVTLLVPSVQTQKSGAAISASALVQAVNALTADRSFLKASKLTCSSDKVHSNFYIFETSMFWEYFSQRQLFKHTRIAFLSSLKAKLAAKTQSKRPEPLDNSDPAKTLMYMQLQELNARMQEGVEHSVKFDAEFSEEEFGGEGESKHVFAVANPKQFRSSGVECVKVEPCPYYQKRLIQ